MNAKRARKYNMRRKFFNEGKGPQCAKCGALLVKPVNLLGEQFAAICAVCN
jgi:hypothetical protein